MSQTFDWGSRTEDEISYAEVCDELNDGGPHCLTLDDLEPRWVKQAERWAKQNDRPWPPAVGDFDRYYDWCVNDRSD